MSAMEPSLHHPVDVLTALQAADSGPARLATLPWVAAYLTFLPRDPAATAGPYFRSVPTTCCDWTSISMTAQLWYLFCTAGPDRQVTVA